MPALYVDQLANIKGNSDGVDSGSSTSPASSSSRDLHAPRQPADAEKGQGLELQLMRSAAIAPQKTADGIVFVDWYTNDDPANPQNWSCRKKAFVIFVLCIYTWTVYCAGPIYATGEEGIQREFGIGPVASTLGLALYILAYGIGDLLFAPLTEIPVIGRNPVYWGTIIIFWALSFPTATANSFGGLLALRFFTGFFASPALANGGATVGDMLSLMDVPFGLSWWFSRRAQVQPLGLRSGALPRRLKAGDGRCGRFYGWHPLLCCCC